MRQVDSKKSRTKSATRNLSKSKNDHGRSNKIHQRNDNGSIYQTNKNHNSNINENLNNPILDDKDSLMINNDEITKENTNDDTTNDTKEQSHFKAIEELVNQFRKGDNHNYVEMTWFLSYYNKTCYNMSYLYSIGTSVQNRELWVMALGEYPNKHIPGIPEVKLIANVHGNEISGKEILLSLIKYICENIKSDPEFTYLLKRLRLHILPSLNPDGYEMSFNKGFGDKFIGRLNSNGVDINRNFPDQFFPSYHDIEPETNAMMNWLRKIPFVLSASYHDGAVAISYPYDDSPSGQTKYSATPDDDIFRRISIVYAENHPTIHQDNNGNCKSQQIRRFVGGVTNGAEWSSLTNTMQDYNYVYTNCFEITIHLTCERNITYNNITTMFNDNLKSTKEFIKQGLRGIKGFVYTDDGKPLQGVKISVNDRKHDIITSKDGDYWRILLPGTYQLTAQLKGYSSMERIVTVDFDEAKVVNITLLKKPADMALIKLGHVGLMKKISNIMLYESDGRDFDDSITSLQTSTSTNNNINYNDSSNLYNNDDKKQEDTFEETLTNKLTSNNQYIEEINKNIPKPTLTTISTIVQPENIQHIKNISIGNSNKNIKNIHPRPNKITTNVNVNNTLSNDRKDGMAIGVKLNCSVSGKSSNIEGVMRWMGKIKELSKDPKFETPLIVGLELYKDEELATDGMFLGVRYFKTEPKRAYFVPAKFCDIKT